MKIVNKRHPERSEGSHRDEILRPALAGLRMTVEFITIALIFSSTCAMAATYDIDPAHSSVEFKIRHLVGRVTGGFREFEGTIVYDATNEAASATKVKINVDSIDTHNGNRDMHLKTADFFDSSNFPKITFVSKKVDPSAKKMTGDLTMHGVTKEVELDYAFRGTAPDKKGFTHLGGSGKTLLHRKDFGINYDPTTAMIGDEVEVQIEIEAIQRQSDTQ